MYHYSPQLYTLPASEVLCLSVLTDSWKSWPQKSLSCIKVPSYRNKQLSSSRFSRAVLQSTNPQTRSLDFQAKEGNKPGQCSPFSISCLLHESILHLVKLHFLSAWKAWCDFNISTRFYPQHPTVHRECSTKANPFIAVWYWITYHLISQPPTWSFNSCFLGYRALQTRNKLALLCRRLHCVSSHVSTLVLPWLAAVQWCQAKTRQT